MAKAHALQMDAFATVAILGRLVSTVPVHTTADRMESAPRIPRVSVVAISSLPVALGRIMYHSQGPVQTLLLFAALIPRVPYLWVHVF